MKRSLLLGLLCLSALSAPSAVKDSDAVRAIIGEAANQGPDGMLAVACAIRNRSLRMANPLKGVFGLHARFVDGQPAWVWARARAAWGQSARTDVTAGATHWENTKAFGEPYWAKTMHRTVRIGDHQFFKP